MIAEHMHSHDRYRGFILLWLLRHVRLSEALKLLHLEHSTESSWLFIG